MSESIENEKHATTRPKAISSKMDRAKTAPNEEFFQISEGESSDYYNSYNYYLYYYSQKHPNPRLPKPTYSKPSPDIDFIKGSLSKKDDKYLSSFLINTEEKLESSEGNDSFNGKKEEILKMMGTLNLKDNTSLSHEINNINQDSTTLNITYSNKDSNYNQNQENTQFDYHLNNEHSYNTNDDKFYESFNNFHDYNRSQVDQMHSSYKQPKKTVNYYQYISQNYYNPTEIYNPIKNPYNYQFNNSYNNQQQIYPFSNTYINGLPNNRQEGLYNNSANHMITYNQYPNYSQNDYYSYPRPNSLDIQGPDMNSTLDELLKNLIDLCRDHNGSRVVQKKYEEGSDDDKSQIFNKLFEYIAMLSKDQFGNYVIQKLFEFSENSRRRQIISQLEGQIHELTLDTYGCRVVQKAIDVLGIDDIKKILKEIKKDIKKCIEDQNGNHAIQKLVEKLPKGEHVDILKHVYNRAFELSTHQYGCRVIQRIFEFCQDCEKEKLLNEILNRPLEVIQDQYGNYVIQHILEKQSLKLINKIFKYLSGKIFEFSEHKFASNVVEKCLCLGNEYQRKAIIDEILIREDDSLLSMVKDKYGNYVVQKMIEFSNQKTKEMIINKICTSQSLKKRDGFSKHVINFIEKMGFPIPGSLVHSYGR